MTATQGRATRFHIAPAGGDTGKPLNLQKRISHLRRYLKVDGSRILDCGCGDGEYVQALLDLGAEAWGIEYNQDKVASFKRNHRFPERVFVGDTEQLSFPDGSFDSAILNEVLEHLPDDTRGLREVRRVLKPDGMLVIFSPSRLYPFETHGVFRKGTQRRIPHYVPFIPYIPLGIGMRFFDYWARNYWPVELRRMVRDAGFRIVAKDYVWQTLENISNNQPRLVARYSPALRAAFQALEHVPLIRCFGVSQLIVARKTIDSIGMPRCGFATSGEGK